MIINSRFEARKSVEHSFELASKLHMTVINVFHKDLITGEIVLTDMFSHDSIQAVTWRDNYLESLKKLEVPYICYVGDHFTEASGYLDFEE
jgi:hypothetical protein